MKICVFGASGRELDRDYYEAAEELGALIAEHGHTLVFGGSRNGLMGAAAHGAAVCGGKVIGVMPREYDLPDVTFQGCTELIYTDTVAERKRIMQEQSDGFIILPGGLGTLDEFFDTLAQRQLEQAVQADRAAEHAGLLLRAGACDRKLREKGLYGAELP